MKVLYFEGAGWSGADISKATIGNCRIRTAFHLDDGRAVYLEIIGTERTKRSSPQIFQWQYTGFVDYCHYITDDEPNDDCNNHHVMLPEKRGAKRGTVEKNARFEYTESEILRLVNSLGAGGEFQFDSEMTARREAVHKWVYDLELRELKEDRASGGKRLCHSPSGSDFPNFSLWVDRNDPGLLHLLRHFVGQNKHWCIRTDAGDTLEDCLATMQEEPLGKYGC